MHPKQVDRILAANEVARIQKHDRLLRKTTRDSATADHSLVASTSAPNLTLGYSFQQQLQLQEDQDLDQTQKSNLPLIQSVNVNISQLAAKIIGKKPERLRLMASSKMLTQPSVLQQQVQVKQSLEHAGKKKKQEEIKWMFTREIDMGKVPTHQAKQLKHLEVQFLKEVMQDLFEYAFNPVTEGLQRQQKDLHAEQQLALMVRQFIDKDNALSKTASPSTTAENQIDLYSKEFHLYLKEYCAVLSTQAKSSEALKDMKEREKRVSEIIERSRSKLMFYESQLNNMSMRKQSFRKSITFAADQSPIHLKTQPTFPIILLSERTSNDAAGRSSLSNILINNSNKEDTKDEVIANSTASLSNRAVEGQGYFNMSGNTSGGSSPVKLIRTMNSSGLRMSTTLPTIPTDSLRIEADSVFEQLVTIPADPNCDTETSEGAVKIERGSKRQTNSDLLPHIKFHLKRSSQASSDKHNQELMRRAATEDASSLLKDVFKLQKQCRCELFKTKRVRNDSIKNKVAFSRSFKKIGQALSNIS